MTWTFFIGPESDHWLCLSLTPQLTNWLTHSLLFSGLDGCEWYQLLDDACSSECVLGFLLSLVSDSITDWSGDEKFTPWQPNTPRLNRLTPGKKCVGQFFRSKPRQHFCTNGKKSSWLFSDMRALKLLQTALRQHPDLILSKQYHYFSDFLPEFPFPITLFDNLFTYL